MSSRHMQSILCAVYTSTNSAPPAAAAISTHIVDVKTAGSIMWHMVVSHLCIPTRKQSNPKRHVMSSREVFHTPHHSNITTMHALQHYQVQCNTRGQVPCFQSKQNNCYHLISRMCVFCTPSTTINTHRDMLHDWVRNGTLPRRAPIRLASNCSTSILAWMTKETKNQSGIPPLKPKPKTNHPHPPSKKNNHRYCSALSY